MRFSLYSEMQDWGEKSWSQTYDEVLEQVVNADRLGYHAYGLVEHFCFPKFSISPDPIAFFAACAQNTRGSSSVHSSTASRTTTRSRSPRGSPPRTFCSRA